MKKGVASNNLRPNMRLVYTVIILVCFGMIMIYSSSAIMNKYSNDSLYFFKKHLLWLIISLLGLYIFYSIDYNMLPRYSNILFVLNIILLILVLFCGEPVNNARRWLKIGFGNFQPSEMAKLTTILILASYLDRNRSKIKNFWKELLPVLCLIGIVAVLILREPDVGTPVIILSVAFAILFIAGVDVVHLLIISLLTFLVIFCSEVLLVQYRFERLLAFLFPWKNMSATGFQICQSYLALGSGGFWGKGLGKSIIKRFFLYGTHTDFIFSIIGEEIGFLGTFFTVALFVYFFICGYRVAQAAQNFLGTLLASGITLTIITQAFFHIGVCCGLLPTKGLPLPFFSYGGSSLLFTMCNVGILLNISRYKKKYSSL